MRLGGNREVDLERRPANVAHRIEISRPATGTLMIRLAGDWTLAHGLPSFDRVEAALATGSDNIRITFESAGLGTWDSSLVTYLMRLTALSAKTGATLDSTGLPAGVRRLIELANAVPERKDAARNMPRAGFSERLGVWIIDGFESAKRTVGFIGEVALAIGRLARGQARMRAADFMLFAQQSGAQALPIVTIVSLLLGLILAFVGAVELKQFGADIYVANLVSVAMFREMAAVMTAIVLAGRTGAAYAAHIGTMQVNEEVDALIAMGIPPVEYLVLPRVLALVVMTPLLCVYANLMGLIGGYLVVVSMLNVTGLAYIEQTQQSVTMTDFSIGIVKGVVFGMIVAVCGCLKGINCGRSAADVGGAATEAVVTSILFIIIADGLFGVILNILGL
jgi:phospholipid/cholesterol/gamma-HCH transport system permease protein